MNTAVAKEHWQDQIIDGKFPLLEWLGGSATNAVFRTELPTRSPQQAAIKLIPAHGQDAALQISRWKTAAALLHPNLLRLFHMGQAEIGRAQWLYVVMEYAEENLEQVLPQRALSSREVGELLPPVLDALSYIHSRGLVHGRVKPSNILAARNQLKLSSDRLHVSDSSNKTLQPTAYDAPELESQASSSAADVWSVGMTLITAFTQQPLNWKKSNPKGPEVPLSIPGPYRKIAQACLRTNPSERCTLEDIKEWLSPEKPFVLPKTVLPETAAPTSRRRKLITPILALVALGAVLFGVRLMKDDSGSRPARTQPANGQPSESTNSPQPPAAVSSSNVSAPAGSAAGAVAERVLPAVPVSARRTIQGKVRVQVRVSVSPSGEISSATLASPGPSRYFARLALDASRRWKFRPAEVDGQPVASQWLLEYKFGRVSTEVVPLEQR